MSTVSNSPESNCSYLACIWSVKELYSFWTSYTVIKKQKKQHVCLVWNCWLMKLEKKPPKWVKVSSRTAVGKDQRVNYVRLANYANELSGKWLEILREPSHQKLVCKKSNCCKIQVCQRIWNYMLHAAWYLARLYEICYIKGVKRNKNSHNTVDLRHLSLILKESKVHSKDIMLQLYYSCQRSQKSIWFAM